MAKVFLVVDIFVAEGDGKNALGEKVAFRKTALVQTT